jgi:hypothetical protein
VWREPGGDRERLAVVLHGDRRTRITHTAFPYTVQLVEDAAAERLAARITGTSRKPANRVRITEMGTYIEQLVATRPDRPESGCMIDGSVEKKRPDAKPAARLVIRAVDIPLDKQLAGATGPEAAQAMEQLSLQGLATSARADVRQDPGKELTYTVDARVEDVAFLYPHFPYRITRAAGQLTLTPQSVAIKSLSGVHGDTPVSISGKLLLHEGRMGADLRLHGTRVPLDKELRAALPPNGRRTWDRLALSGTADLVADVQHKNLDKPEEVDYRITIDAIDVSARYAEFPYPLKHVSGQAVLTPGLTVLKKMKVKSGDMTAVLSGQIATEGDEDIADLVLEAANVPIDKVLLAAIPQGLQPIAQRFRPGGKADVSLKRLRLRRASATTRPVGPEAGESAPAVETRPAAPPATQPAAETWYLAEGTVTAADVVLDVGLGPKQVSGTLTGTISSQPEGLSLAAKATDFAVAVGPHVVDKLVGTLRKSRRSSVVAVKVADGSIHGGRLTGVLEMKLADPFEYGVQVSLSGLKVGELINAGIEDPKKKTDAKGRLSGDMQLIAVAGKPEKTKAVGYLEIADAKLVRMPVMMGLLHVFYLSLPGESVFTDGSVRYQLNGRTMTFEEVYLVGAGMNIVGSGTLKMDSQKLKLHFLTSPKAVPRIKGLDSLLETMLKEIVEIQVTGTLSAPKTRAVSLRSLEQAIRRLTNPGLEK